MFPDDGDKDDDCTFSQRNTYIGIKGGFGQVQAGIFDTPFKKAQNKLTCSTICRAISRTLVSNSENREKNAVQYNTPEFAGLVLTVDHINSEDTEENNGLSSSLTYTRGACLCGLCLR